MATNHICALIMYYNLQSRIAKIYVMYYEKELHIHGYNVIGTEIKLR